MTGIVFSLLAASGFAATAVFARTERIGMLILMVIVLVDVFTPIGILSRVLIPAISVIRQLLLGA